MSMEHFHSGSPPTMMNVHGCYSDDNENLKDKMDNEDDTDDNMDDTTGTSIRIASTIHSAITTRRLTNTKVREIFEYLYTHYDHNNNVSSVPTIPIPFTIVPVNSNGKALSPPSYEFKCTLYTSID